jgi:hypothetical protein
MNMKFGFVIEWIVFLIKDHEYKFWNDDLSIQYNQKVRIGCSTDMSQKKFKLCIWLLPLIRRDREQKQNDEWIKNDAFYLSKICFFNDRELK